MFMDETRSLALCELEKNIGYEFRDKDLLNLALVHSSYSNEHSRLRGRHNERLEFLGDAVMELVFTEKIYRDKKFEDEGFLTKMRAKLVCEKSFAHLADKLGLASLLLLGKGEEKTGGRNKNSIKADAMEALAGAIYLDGGLEAIASFIDREYKFLLDSLKDNTESFVDYKTILQEYFHKKNYSEFKYILCKEEGPAHDKVFYMDVYLNSRSVGKGRGKNKKEAEQMASRDALIRYGVINE
ncbi:ribonuclease III [Peptoniphilaceae bacterium SGI.131]